MCSVLYVNLWACSSVCVRVCLYINGYRQVRAVGCTYSWVSVLFVFVEVWVHCIFVNVWECWCSGCMLGFGCIFVCVWLCWCCVWCWRVALLAERVLVCLVCVVCLV